MSEDEHLFDVRQTAQIGDRLFRLQKFFIENAVVKGARLRGGIVHAQNPVSAFGKLRAGRKGEIVAAGVHDEKGDRRLGARACGFIEDAGLTLA